MKPVGGVGAGEHKVIANDVAPATAPTETVIPEPNAGAKSLVNAGHAQSLSLSQPGAAGVNAAQGDPFASSKLKTHVASVLKANPDGFNDFLAGMERGLATA
jgi:hypothetical protein